MIRGGGEELPMEHESAPDPSVVARFDGEMVDIYRRTGEAFDYWPNYFLRMVRNEGGVVAARKLLRDHKVSEGFLRLVKARRLDLSVEYFVIKPRYASLFTPEERKVARDRLGTYGFDFERYGVA
jgi:hypothetical protein